MPNERTLVDAQLPDRDVKAEADEIVAYLPEKRDELEGVSTNWRERWALSQVKYSCGRSVWWDYVGPVVWVAAMTKMISGLEVSWMLQGLVWIGAGWMVDESIRNRALMAIITRLNQKK